ncbi:major capsid protein [Streptosporangium sp. G12]
MPVTLAQAQVNTQDDVDYTVIDNLRRYSWLMDQIVFDDVVTPGSTGDASLTYAYTRLLTPRQASFRQFNTEFNADKAIRQRYTVDLKPLGGAFNVDRKLARLGPAATNEIAFQMQELLTSIKIKFQDELINGDTAVDSAGFDGLDKILTNSTTEYDPNEEGISTGYVDWTMSTVDTQAEAMTALSRLDDWLSRIVPSRVGSGSNLGTAGALPVGVKAILGNTTSITRLRGLARWAGMYTANQDALGRHIEMYGPWNLVDIGDGVTGSSPIIPIETRDADGVGAGGNITGLTDLYAVSFGLDAFHGASMAGSPLIETYLPDFTEPGAVKTGEIEMGPVAAVLRNVKACGVFRNVKVS